MIGRRAFALAFAPLCAVTVACWCGNERPDPVRVGRDLEVYVLRHAEKEVPAVEADAADPMAKSPADPPLSRAGQVRALALPKALPLSELRGIYSTPFLRTRQTVDAVAAVTGLSVVELPPDDIDGLLDAIDGHGAGAVLVVGHSNTVPEILAGLGVRERIEIRDDQYGDLFVVHLADADTPIVRRERYGD
jgi:phosphohistidine phosphatase SixA